MRRQVLSKSVWSVIVLFYLISVPNLFGQFTVISTNPVHGSTSVDTATTFSITFNAPLDTSARFAHPGDFFLNLYFFPDSLVGEPDSITMSPDMQTVNVHNLHFAENTAYIFVIVNAVNQSSDSLDLPYAVVFTTGASLPANSVSGTVTHPQNDPEGILVFLFNANPFESEGDTESSIGTIVTQANGDYTIDFVEAGTYWPAAIQNFYVDQDNEIEFLDGTVLGLYDFDGDNQPDSIVVPPNQSNVDITLYQVLPTKAKTAYSKVEPKAQTWASDAVLLELEGDIEPDGFSPFWDFIFYSPSLQEYRLLFAMGDYVVESSFSEQIDDTLALPGNWLDSDAVMAIAESNGGSDFRASQQNVDLRASLEYITFGYGYGAVPLNPAKSAIKSSIDKAVPLIESPKSIFSVDGPAVWMVDYDSDTSHLSIVMDAVTGELLSSPTTAKVAEQNAKLVAQDWSSDVELWAVFGDWSNVDIQGKTEFWNCVYYSPGLDSFRHVSVMGQLPAFDSPLGWDPPDSSTISIDWLDSDVTMAIAEGVGGSSYRGANQDVFVRAQLERWWYGDDPSKTVWKFIYQSSTASPFEVIVDAEDGSLPTAIEKENGNTVPHRFELHHSYPNPFNPISHIQFSVPRMARVEVSIYNLLGQQIETLIDKQLPAGTYEILWQPRGLASGTYIISLKANEFQTSQRIVFMK
jgi:methionine-rich copper-binding protein CopC